MLIRFPARHRNGSPPPVGERALILAAMAAIVALSWAYLLAGAAHFGTTAAIGDGAPMHLIVVPWTAKHAALMVLMWAVMMVAMMLPGAVPTVLPYAAVARRFAPQERRSAGPIALFVAGYVLVWSAFSAGATALQWGLQHLALLSPEMVIASPRVGGGILVAAGLYQWSPLKDRCLALCRFPLAFIGRYWRPGRGGALRMGLHHGLFCLACCWGVMLLLFVGGIMNLTWVVILALFVLSEKLTRVGSRVGRWISGVGLIAAGTLLLTLGQTI